MGRLSKILCFFVLAVFANLAPADDHTCDAVIKNLVKSYVNNPNSCAALGPSLVRELAKNQLSNVVGKLKHEDLKCSLSKSPTGQPILNLAPIPTHIRLNADGSIAVMTIQHSGVGDDLRKKLSETKVPSKKDLKSLLEGYFGLDYSDAIDASVTPVRSGADSVDFQIVVANTKERVKVHMSTDGTATFTGASGAGYGICNHIEAASSTRATPANR